jgi:hypothetical protein
MKQVKAARCLLVPWWFAMVWWWEEGAMAQSVVQTPPRMPNFWRFVMQHTTLAITD